MMVTALSVINIFTDEFDNVKAEGKFLSVKPCRCQSVVQLPLVHAFNEAGLNVDTNLCAWLY